MKKKNIKIDPKTQAFKRSLFYAIILFAVFQFIVVPLQRSIYVLFVLSAVIGFLIVLGEILFSTVREYRRHISFELLHLKKSVRRDNLLNHILLPSLLYISGVLFLLFNRVTILDQVAIVLLTGTFFGLLYSISCTYLHLYSVARKFKLIFDFSKIIIFYFLTNSVINIVLFGGYHTLFIYVGTFVPTFLLLLLMVYLSEQLNWTTLMYVFFSSLIMSLVVLGLFIIPVLSTIAVSLVATIFFYLLVVAWHHKLEGTFSWDLMSEYGLFAIMAVILVLYL